MKMREYRGNGQITFELSRRITQDVPFVIDFHSDGTINVSAELDPFGDGFSEIVNSQNASAVWCSLTGKLTDNGSVFVSRMVIDKTNISFSQAVGAHASIVCLVMDKVIIEYASFDQSLPITTRAGLTNLVFGGLEWTVYPDGTHKLNKFSALVGGKNVVFEKLMDYDGIVEKLCNRSEPLVTSELVIQGSATDESNLLDSVCFLLSFASRTSISPIFEDYYQNESRVKTVLNPFHTEPYCSGHNLIDLSQLGNADLKNYLERTYTKFEEEKSVLGLKTVVNYYFTAHSSKYLETQYLLLVVCLECFASYYAKRAKDQGRTITSEDIAHKQARLTAILSECEANKPELFDKLSKFLYIKVGLKDIIRDALAFYSVRFEPRDLEFTKIRAEIIHTGKFPEGMEPIKEIANLTFLIDRLILSVLGYSGMHLLDIRNRYTRIALE